MEHKSDGRPYKNDRNEAGKKRQILQVESNRFKN